MNNDTWQAVFLTRTCALAGGEKNATDDAWEEARSAYARWQETHSHEDSIRDTNASSWHFRLYRHARAVLEARWRREDAQWEEYKERVAAEWGEG